ncbi:hypothetical protein V8F20_010213 [Naviculisporaceae sp. PSN 640]
MLYATIGIFCLALLSSIASCLDEFIAPPIEGLNVTLGSTFILSWTLERDSPPNTTLVAYQDAGDGQWVSEVLLDDVPNPGKHHWTAKRLPSLPVTNGFHFALFEVGAADTAFTQVLFNSGPLFIVDPLASTPSDQSSTTETPFPSSTSTSSTSSSDLVTSATSTTTTTGISSSSQPPSQTQDGKTTPSTTEDGKTTTTTSSQAGDGPGSRLSVGAIAGVISAVVGFLALILGWLVYRRAKKDQAPITQVVIQFGRDIGRMGREASESVSRGRRRQRV